MHCWAAMMIWFAYQTLWHVSVREDSSSSIMSQNSALCCCAAFSVSSVIFWFFFRSRTMSLLYDSLGGSNGLKNLSLTLGVALGCYYICGWAGRDPWWECRIEKLKVYFGQRPILYFFEQFDSSLRLSHLQSNHVLEQFSNWKYPKGNLKRMMSGHNLLDQKFLEQISSKRLIKVLAGVSELISIEINLSRALPRGNLVSSESRGLGLAWWVSKIGTHLSFHSTHDFLRGWWL